MSARTWSELSSRQKLALARSARRIAASSAGVRARCAAAIVALFSSTSASSRAAPARTTVAACSR